MDKINDNGDNVRIVEPVPFTDGNKDFTVNITPKEVELLKDEAGDIHFSKVIYVFKILSKKALLKRA